jgi:heme exporter protein B
VTALRKAWALAAKDLMVELRTWEMAAAMLVMAVLALFVFSLALDLRGAVARAAAAPGVFWSAVLFSGTLGLSRSMARERQSRCIDGLLLAPMDPAVIWGGKALGVSIVMVVVEAALLFLMVGLFGVSLLRPDILLVLALGTLGYAAVGTLVAAMAANTRAREVLLPVLLLPLAVPVLIAAVQATGALAEGATLADVAGWVRLLVVYDLTMAAVCLLTFGYVVEEE